MPNIRPALVAALALAIVTCHKETKAPPPPPDTTAKWREVDVDVFAGMDGITLDPKIDAQNEALRGRIVWNLWVGDSGLMWDWLAQHGFGTADLLKTIDSRRRDERFAEIGIINQPGFMAPAKPDKYGLFLDVPRPGDTAGQIDRHIDYATYGRSSGVVGLRISDNPKFDKVARDKWMKHVDPKDGINHDFYEKPAYYNDPQLVRPYIVGMACALCHVSFDPVRPPGDVNNPRWENLNDYVGAQYFKVGEFFVPRRVVGGKAEAADETSFVWQLLHSNPPGALDTSFIATDYLNNPGTMNGIFNVAQRLERAANGVTVKQSKYDPMVEQLAGGALDLKWLSLDEDQKIPRVLKQGDDSVGFEGALSRVYVNIGHAWPVWSRHFRPLIGGPLSNNPRLASQSPVGVKELQRDSASWNWSEGRSRALATYFVTYAKPLLLKNAPGGKDLWPKDQKMLDRGKIVFAENCASCHSSRQPPFDPFGPDGRPTEAAKNWFRTEAMKPEFFTDNFFSDERRHSVRKIGTNATRAAATNATRNHIWDNFSSETYKNLPAVGAFEVDNPSAIGKRTINIPLPGEGNGPGYYRPPSLVSLWSSAPYLHNNTVGIDPMKLTPGKVDAASRMKAFQDGIEKMLWIKPRGTLVWTTTRRSSINVPLGYLPKELRDGITLAAKRHPGLIDKSTDSLKIGPIPAGTPINLIANTNLEAGLGLAMKRIALYRAIVETLVEIESRKLDEPAAEKLMARNVVPKFLEVNKCPDFYEDKGHPFGKNLPMADKRALIELLKTF